MLNLETIREHMRFATNIPESILQHIHNEKWLQIWVPKQYNGLGLPLKEGLTILKKLAQTNGSLGWMVTLCAGANYFSRNLKPEIAKTLFKDNFTCFGGSGAICGTAEQLNGTFLINGQWIYATGAPYLSHFTLNAVVTKNNAPVLKEDGTQLVKSFIIHKADVEIIADWKAMGMQATGTFSFKVENVIVTENHSFSYDTFYTDSILDKIPFRVFADLTLLVNYLGMAAHFVEEAEKIRPHLNVETFTTYLLSEEQKVYAFADKVETLLEKNQEISAEMQTEIHQFGEQLVSNVSHNILDLYFQLGIRASHTNEPIQQIFRDYFTATQHVNFRIRKQTPTMF